MGQGFFADEHNHRSTDTRSAGSGSPFTAVTRLAETPWTTKSAGATEEEEYIRVELHVEGPRKHRQLRCVAAYGGHNVEPGRRRSCSRYLDGLSRPPTDATWSRPYGHEGVLAELPIGLPKARKRLDPGFIHEKLKTGANALALLTVLRQHITGRRDYSTPQ